VRNVEALLHAFDIFALPSKTEGLSIALLEACAAGLAVVATRVGGNPEIIVDGITGLLVDVDDAQGLANALENMLAHPGLRQHLGNAASEWVRKHASMESLQVAYDGFYEEALLS
jgi:glycosyltransferase involved in cell wall biosynthesis